MHPPRDLLRAGFASQLSNQLAGDGLYPINHLDHMHGNPDRASLIGNCSGDRLTNPPGRISRKLIATSPIKLLHASHQSEISLLDKIKKMQSAVLIFFGNRNYEAQI